MEQYKKFRVHSIIFTLAIVIIGHLGDVSGLDILPTKGGENIHMQQKRSAVDETKKNCSLVYMSTDVAVKNETVPHFGCKLGIWYIGEYPSWLHSRNVLEALAKATEEELNEFAKKTCACGMIDISDVCSAEVKIAAKKIMDRC